MATKQRLAIQTKIFGVMLQDARSANGKTQKECADALGISSRVYRNYELGRSAISLPELEVLAYYLNVPISHFWESDVVSDNADSRKDLNLSALMPIRHKLVGARLRAAREEQNITQKDLAEVAGISPRRLSSYESGDAAIAITELEAMAVHLGLRVSDFVEQGGPVAAWVRLRQAQVQLEKMPPEMQEFVGNPSNKPYLELAIHLSGLNVERLRVIAESLLDITY